MNRRILSFLLIVFPCLISSASAQYLSGEVEDRQVLLTLDTLLTRRGYGDWWFGLSTGITLNGHLGDLRLPRNYTAFTNKSILDLGSGSGVGYGLSLLGEWNPVDSKWGGMVQISALEIQKGVFNYIIPNSHDEYEGDATLKYITISPAVRYDLPIGGLYGFGGIDLKFNIASTMTLVPIHDQDASARLKTVNTVPFQTNTVQCGVTIGAGYDFLLFEFSKEFRVRMSPFVALHYGSSVSGDYGSSWNVAYARAGVSLKIGKNRKMEAILPYDSTYQAPPVVLASLDKQVQFELPLLASSERMEAMDLAIIERKEIAEAVSTPSSVSVEAGRKPRTELPPIKIDPNIKKVFPFQSTFTTSFDSEMQRYLDAIAEYLKSHPTAEVRIVGHTDGFGTPEETQRISEDRANQVVKYLQRKGIPNRRLLASGVGARNPVADNRTEEGRKRNRRVEITVVER